jgi:programmed cell death protein 5
MVASTDEELNALRAQRLRVMQQQVQEQALSQLEAEEQAKQQAEEISNIESTLRQCLTPEARARLARISMVEPTRALAIKADLISMYQEGEFTAPMSDASLKQLLAQQSKSRSNASIRRI